MLFKIAHTTSIREQDWAVLPPSDTRCRPLQAMRGSGSPIWRASRLSTHERRMVMPLQSVPQQQLR